MLLFIMLVIFTAPQDYDQGLKFVTFNKNSQSAVLCIDIYPDDNNTYTGNRIFDLIIDGGVLPTCLVPCTTSEPEVTCTIIDNECKCIIYVLKVS